MSSNGCVRNQQSDRSDLLDEMDPVWQKVRFYHRDDHYCIIISHNTSVPTIGHLELAIATLTSHASWAWLIKICPWSQIFLRCIWADCVWLLIVNEFKQIGSIGLIRMLIMNSTILSHTTMWQHICNIFDLPLQWFQKHSQQQFQKGDVFRTMSCPRTSSINSYTSQLLLSSISTAFTFPVKCILSHHTLLIRKWTKEYRIISLAQS